MSGIKQKRSFRRARLPPLLYVRIYLNVGVGPGGCAGGICGGGGRSGFGAACIIAKEFWLIRKAAAAACGAEVGGGNWSPCITSSRGGTQFGT